MMREIFVKNDNEDRVYQYWIMLREEKYNQTNDDRNWIVNLRELEK